MILYPTVEEVKDLHIAVVAQSGGHAGVRDEGALQSAVAQPAAAVGGRDLYPSLAEKAAALCYSLIQNHPLIDGNKRTAHAATLALLMLNGNALKASVDEQEHVLLEVASGKLDRAGLADWLRKHLLTKVGQASSLSFGAKTFTEALFADSEPLLKPGGTGLRACG